MNTKADLHDLSNGTVFELDGTEYLKVRTEKDRYGSPTNLEVVQLDSETIKELHCVNGRLYVTDPNPIAFGGNSALAPSDVTVNETDKELLREYIGRIQRGEL